MKLNTRTQCAQQPTQNTPIVLIHGLFGSLDNLGVLARDLVADHDVVQVDLRNHGLSGRSETMDYPAMAQDILETLDALGLNKVILIGHSMGGKAAMAVTRLRQIALKSWWRLISRRWIIRCAVTMKYSMR